MKTVEKYTAIQVTTQIVNDTVEINLKYGNIEGPYYSTTHPEEEFDTKEKAIEWAYKHDKWSKWMIVPVITFDNYTP